MEETVDKVLAIQDESRGRLLRSKGRGAISAIVGVASFETPRAREELI